MGKFVESNIVIHEDAFTMAMQLFSELRQITDYCTLAGLDPKPPITRCLENWQRRRPDFDFVWVRLLKRVADHED